MPKTTAFNYKCVTEKNCLSPKERQYRYYQWEKMDLDTETKEEYASGSTSIEDSGIHYREIQGMCS